MQVTLLYSANQTNGVENVDWKICKGCGKPFFLKDIDPASLKHVPFSSFKRCPTCRHRTDIRCENYFEKYKRNKAKTVISVVTGIDKIVVTLVDDSRRRIISPERESTLNNKLLNGTISVKELKRLKNHYESILFLLHHNLYVDPYPFRFITDLNKDILKMVFPDL